MIAETLSFWFGSLVWRFAGLLLLLFGERDHQKLDSSHPKNASITWYKSLVVWGKSRREFLAPLPPIRGAVLVLLQSTCRRSYKRDLHAILYPTECVRIFGETHTPWRSFLFGVFLANSFLPPCKTFHPPLYTAIILRLSF